jgi:ubiquitin-protein ligase
MLIDYPSHGIVADLESKVDLSQWKAEITGPQESPFQDGIFSVEVQFPYRYPMEPPSCRFSCTPAPYHPNIDSLGCICLDTLKSPPAGSWSPAVSLPSLLLALRTILVGNAQSS